MVKSTSTVIDFDAVNLELHKQVNTTIYVAFTTTGATVTFAVPKAFRRFRLKGFTWATVPDSVETLYVDGSTHTLGSDGVYTATDGGSFCTITIGRVAASTATSGLGVFVDLVGYP